MAVTLLASELAYAQTTYPFDLPAQPMAESLRAVGRLTHTNILFDPPLVDGLRAPALKATLTLKEAFARLLAGTALKGKFLDDATVTIAREAPPPVSSNPRSDMPSSKSDLDVNGNEEQSSLSDNAARMAQTAPGVRADTQGPGTTAQTTISDSENTPRLQEVVVTAQKRQERLIDAPQSVSVLSADTLAELGATQFADFANTVPGVGFTTAGAGYTQISMRGVTTGEETNPSVGIYVDDVPYGSSTAFAFGGQYALDMNLLDVDRIEILRGPQGTLYGASTMGGLVKYVSKLPDSTAFAGDVRAGLSAVHDGGVSYDGAIAVNLPLSSGVAALRASAFYSKDGGYIDNLGLGQSNVNRSNVHGGRLDLLLTPSDPLSIRLGAVLQNISRGGQSSADYTLSGTPAYGSLGQYRLNPEPFDQQFQLFSGTVAYDFGPAALTSISSYQAVHTQVFYDFSAEFLPFFDAPPPGGLGFAYGAVGFPDTDSTSKFTQEVRLASAGHRQLEWIVGGFYTHEASVDREAFTTKNAAGQPVANDLLTYASPTTYQEYAAFGDVTYHFTDTFDVSGGLRYARNDQTANETATGIFGASYPAPIRSSQGVFTYLANARYHFSGYSTGYARYATGYRPGGPNPLVFNSATGIPEVPPTFLPDQLKSYEIGYNGESADRRFGINADVFYIDWHNLQVITSTSNGFGAYTNASAATVHGVELTLTARPVTGLAMTGAFAYQDPHLTEAASIIGGVAGERLPNSAHFTGSLNTDYTLIDSGVHPSVGATFRYVGDRTASFDQNAATPQYHLPAYRTFDLRGGLMLNTTSIQLYVHNVLDERGQLSAFTGRGPLAQVSLLPPRTVGISATTHF
jgi:outer membrane receptor protein involved in Fe transport